MNHKEKNYYLKNKKKLIKEFNKNSKLLFEVLKKRLNENDVYKIIKVASNNFDNLIPQIPYIGGNKNRSTRNLTGSVMLLAFIQSLESYGLKKEEIGEIIYETFEKMFQQIPKIFGALFRLFLSTKSGQKLLTRKFNSTQFDHYEASWKSTVVENENEDFDFGFNYSSCGICSFFKEQNAEEYIPYLCIGDYAMFKNLKVDLTRTKTIAGGNKICNFRLTRHRNPDKKYISGWPPQNLEEWNGN